jgi:Beta-galactosidase
MVRPLVRVFHSKGLGKGKRELCFRVVASALGLAMSVFLIGCSGLLSPTHSNDSDVTNFGYAESPLAATVVPANRSVTMSGAYFGMTISHLAASGGSSKAVPFPTFPIHTFRLWDVVGWNSLEPADGQYDWTTMDDTIATAKQNGVSDFIFTLGYVPVWASTNPSDPCGGVGSGTCDAPDMRALDDFVTHVVQRYCGVVQYFETWNEPNLKEFWNGTDAQLTSMAGDLYRIAKDPGNCGCTSGVCAPGAGVNPNEVLLPPISSISEANLSWLDAYLAASGPTYPYADVASFHGYGFGLPEDIVDGVTQLEKTLALHGLSSLELWDTEASWGTSTIDDQKQQASWLMRFHIAQEVSAVSRFVWYAYDNCAWGTLWGPTCQKSSDNWQGIRLPGQAYGNVEGWMVGAALDHCEHYQDGFWACQLQRAGGYEGWILWYSNGASRSVRIPAKLQLTKYRDWQNNSGVLPEEITVDQMPVIVEN